MSVPSAAPRAVHAVMVDNSTLRLSWKPPPHQAHNGPLLGYRVLIVFVLIHLPTSVMNMLSNCCRIRPVLRSEVAGLGHRSKLLG